MEPNVIICVGNSGSGKTTWSKDFIKKNPGYLRVNKDEIRSFLTGDLGKIYWKRFDLQVLERTVHKIYQESIKSCLQRGYKVIIDGTNISPNAIPSLLQFLESLDFPIMYKFKIFSCNPLVCKQRVSNRDLEQDLEFIDKFELLFKQTKKVLRKEYPKLILRNVGKYS